MKQSVDQTVNRLVSLIKDSVEAVRLEGVVWYDIASQGLEAEVKLLRLKGEIAHHPVVNTLIRFNN